jgi:hypothetical protein
VGQRWQVFRGSAVAEESYRFNFNIMPIPQAVDRPPALPTSRDFLVSAGFTGVTVLLAAITVFCAVVYASRRAGRRLDKRLEQQGLHHEEARADRRHAEVIDRSWERFVWLVETAGVEPAARDAGEASLGLGPELALELLHGLHRDAKKLGDDTLARAVTVYLTQYGLVLGRQSGPLPEVVAALDSQTPSAPDGKPSEALTAPMKSRTTPKVKANTAKERDR